MVLPPNWKLCPTGLQGFEKHLSADRVLKSYLTRGSRVVGYTCYDSAYNLANLHDSPDSDSNGAKDRNGMSEAVYKAYLTFLVSSNNIRPPYCVSFEDVSYKF
jgi:hypothetical protein